MNNNNINNFLFENIDLVVVSKNRTIQEIKNIYKQDIFDFGENKVQELLTKYDTLPKDIKWHFIGHLQKNKVKYISPFVYLIQSVDSIELLEEINKYALKNNRIINFLFQIKIAQENTKYGMDIEYFKNIMKTKNYLQYKNVRIKGLMGMATATNDTLQIKKEYTMLKDIFNFSNKIDENIKILSMGMSSDYKIAMENGSNMIRLGSVIFEN